MRKASSTACAPGRARTAAQTDAAPNSGAALARLQPLQARDHRLAAQRTRRGREGIQAPFEAHDRARLLVQPVAAVERQPDHAAVVLEAVVALAPALRHAEEGVGRRRGRARRRAPGEPALHHLELLGEAGAVGHEDEPALLRQAGLAGGRIGRLPVVQRPVAQAAPEQLRRPAARAQRLADRRQLGVARVGAADVRMEGAGPALGVAAVVEVVQARGVGQRHQRLVRPRVVGRPAAHHLGQRGVAVDDAGRQRLLEHREVLPQLAHGEEAAVVHQASRGVVGGPRALGDRRLVGGVAVADQHLADVHVVRVGRVRLGGGEHRLRHAVAEAEVLAGGAGGARACRGGRRSWRGRGRAQPMHPLQRQGHHVGVGAHQLLQPGHQRGARRGLGRRRVGEPQLQHRVHAGQRDALGGIVLGQVRRGDAEGPVASGQAPARRVVDAQVPEQAGARGHALHEVLGPLPQLVLAQAGAAQAVRRHGQGLHDAVFRQPALGGRHEAAEEARQRLRAAEGEQQQHAVVAVRQGRQDAGLHGVRRGDRREGRRATPAPRRRMAGQAVAEPVDRVGELLARPGHRLRRGLGQPRELRQQLDRGAHEVVAVAVAGRVQIAQPVQADQRAQPLAERGALHVDRRQRLAVAEVARVGARGRSSARCSPTW
ncbi:hypothetical protein ABXN37_18685 [Piscinibacter sakaiensis]|uniref:hypothetical protein n=1 Tax=Piscinibacter sakaiensis TaxID=1547922 RepID=UPI0037283ED8